MLKYWFLGLVLIGLSGLPTLAQERPMPSPSRPSVPAPPGFNIFKNIIPPGVKFNVMQGATCASTETFKQDMAPHKEYSIFQGIATTGRVMTQLYFNSQTTSVTMALHFVSGNTCVLGHGKGVYQQPSPEQIPTYYDSQ